MRRTTDNVGHHMLASTLRSSSLGIACCVDIDGKQLICSSDCLLNRCILWLLVIIASAVVLLAVSLTITAIIDMINVIIEQERLGWYSHCIPALTDGCPAQIHIAQIHIAHAHSGVSHTNTHTSHSVPYTNTHKVPPHTIKHRYKLLQIIVCKPKPI